MSNFEELADHAIGVRIGGLIPAPLGSRTSATNSRRSPSTRDSRRKPAGRATIPTTRRRSASRNSWRNATELEPLGGNLVNVLYTMSQDPERWDEFKEMVRTGFPDFENIAFPADAGQGRIASGVGGSAIPQEAILRGSALGRDALLPGLGRRPGRSGASDP